MLDEKDGWYVVNVAEAEWHRHPLFGMVCGLEKERGLFKQTGVNVHVIWPDKPACRYHRENAQEDFLVLSGECRLLVNGEERHLRAWDFVHCPPGVTHVFVGAGEGPCAILMIGHRPSDEALHYPASELAGTYGAESPEATDDPRVAYSDQPRWEAAQAPPWPPA
jgi:uncharacterized cupin superfamily protein